MRKKGILLTDLRTLINVDAYILILFWRYRIQADSKDLFLFTVISHCLYQCRAHKEYSKVMVEFKNK